MTNRDEIRRVADETFDLVRAVGPSFADKDRAVQGAALADLLAMWIAGHVIRGDKKATKRLREQMLRLHILAVKSLIEVKRNEQGDRHPHANHQATVRDGVKRSVT